MILGVPGSDDPIKKAKSAILSVRKSSPETPRPDKNRKSGDLIGHAVKHKRARPFRAVYLLYKSRRLFSNSWLTVEHMFAIFIYIEH